MVKNWGWNDAEVAVATKEMNQAIQDACEWVDTTFGLENEKRWWHLVRHKRTT
jgi:hypothetical protein